MKPGLKLFHIENILFEKDESNDNVNLDASEPVLKGSVVQKLNSLPGIVRQAKRRHAALRMQQEEKELKMKQLIDKLKGKPRNIYLPSQQLNLKNTKPTNNVKITKSNMPRDKTGHESSKSILIWKRPTPVALADLIRQESEKGRMRRGLSVETSHVPQKNRKKIRSVKTKKSALKTKKTQKKYYNSVTNFTRSPLITVKGIKRFYIRGAHIRKSFEPHLNEVTQLPGIKGVNKGIQINLPIVEQDKKS